MWYKIDGKTLTDIADSIRSKTGKIDKMMPSQMSGEIEGIKQDDSSELDSLIDKSMTSLKTNAGLIGAYACYENNNLIEIYGENVAAIDKFAFTRTSLIEIKYDDLPVLKTIGSSAFYSITTLTKAFFYQLESIDGSAFAYCTNLETFVLYTDKVCDLINSNTFNSTKIKNGTGYFYVPKELIEQYKVATNWVTYAEQFRAIEDYPEITGGV